MIVAVTGWRGTGVTTTALLASTCLAARDGRAWLVEADPAGGALAGRMTVAPHTVGGLERVAFPTERRSAAEAFVEVAHRAGPLSVVTAPVDPFRAHACHQPRMPWMSTLRDLHGSVVLDVGRLRAGSAVWGVLGRADVVLLVAPPEVSGAVSTAEWLQAGGRVSPGDPGLPAGAVRVVVVDSPGGVAFPRVTLQADFAERWGGWLPWEPGTVDLVHRGAAVDDRRLRRSSLIAAAHELVDTLQVAEREGVTP